MRRCGSILFAVVLSVACVLTVQARVVHPVNVYRATLRIESERVILELHADEHSLSHEEALYRNPMDARYTLAGVASSIVLHQEDGVRLAPRGVHVSSGDGGTHAATVEYPRPEGSGVCSIASEPDGPLAQGRRRISITLVRDGADARSIELTSGRNHHVLRLDDTPLEDPSRFIRPRITVRCIGAERTIVHVDFPSSVAREVFRPSGEEDTDGRALLDAYARWARESLLLSTESSMFEKSCWFGASNECIEEDGARNPHTLRLRFSLTLDSRVNEVGWRGFAGGVNACDVYVSRSGEDGSVSERAGVLNRTTSRMPI